MAKDKEQDSQANQIVSDAEVRQQEVFTQEEYLSIEKSRVEADKQRSEVAMAAVKMIEAADERLHEYHMSKLEKESQERREARTSGTKFLWTILLFGMSLIVFLLYMAFYGEGTQSRLSSNFIEIMFTALGGFGIGLLFLSLFRRYFGR